MAVTSGSSRYDALRAGDSHTVLSKNIILSRLVSGWLMANVGCSAYQPLLPFSQARLWPEKLFLALPGDR